MASDDPASQLRQLGIAQLRGAFAKDSLARFSQAAVRCFAAIEAGDSPPERYQFNRYSHSVLLTALADFGCGNLEQLSPDF